MERDLIANASIATIVGHLTRRFQEPPEVALAAINREQFTLYDLRASKSVRAFAARRFRLSRSIRQDLLYQCLLNVWNALDPQIQLYVPYSKASTTMQSFYDDIDAHTVSLSNVLAQQDFRSQLKA